MFTICNLLNWISVGCCRTKTTHSFMYNRYCVYLENRVSFSFLLLPGKGSSKFYILSLYEREGLEVFQFFSVL